MSSKLVIAGGLAVVTVAAVIVVTAAIAQDRNAQQAQAPAAAPACAKLNEVECGGKQGCSWIPGYRIPTGAEVPGYCRPAARSINARRPGSEQPR